MVNACLLQYKAKNPERTKDPGWSVPYSFRVPDGDADWPEKAWGKCLGSIVSDLRMKGTYREHRKELEDLGITFEQIGRNALGWEVMEACIVQYMIANSARTNVKWWSVPYTFRVPYGDADWPVEAWGKGLGRIVYDIRHKGTYKDHHEEMEELGITFDKHKQGGHNALGWEVVEACIEQYKIRNPETTKKKGWIMPRDFEVPDNDAALPEAAWGKGLGYIFNQIRHNGYYKKHRAAAEELGITFEKQKVGGHNALGWDLVKACIVQYKADNPETTKEDGWIMPRDFKVPDGDAAWGKALGRIVSSIRNDGRYKEHRAAAETLGIVVKDGT